MKTLIFTIYFIGLSLAVFAQQDSSFVSPFPFISGQQYQWYVEGNNPEMMLMAEVNNYPSPKNTLRFQKQLELTDYQKSQLRAIATETDRKLAEMSRFLIAEQTKLNTLFKTNKITEGSLIYYTNKIGSLEGELRNAYLRAHIQTRRILTPGQLDKYAQLSNNKTK